MVSLRLLHLRVSMVLDILSELVATVLRMLLEIPVTWTGEVVCWAASLGNHRPRWDCESDGYAGSFTLLSEVSFWIGALTIGIIGSAIKMLFFSSHAPH